MKKFENAKMLNEVEMNAVTGGDDDWTVVDAFVEWLLSPIAEAVEGIELQQDSKTPARPLPFPQDRRGNKAPMAPMAPARPLPFPQDRR
ncbi:MAG: hypothetical protein IJ237_09430 [Oscillospiraceae bacterium]|nr:hypothetical protein [Oscillospiraceae bacterium]